MIYKSCSVYIFSEGTLDYIKIWQDVLSELSKVTSAVSIDVFIKPLEPVVLKDDRLYLLCGLAANKDIIQRNYLGKMNEVVKRLYPNITIIVIDPGEKNELIEKPAEEPGDSSNHTFLNPRYTFDTFVVGKNNQFVHAAARAVTESPGERYNPLFIHGGSGLGKTHIMQAVGNFIRKERPDLLVLYVTCERFMNELIDSISSRTSNIQFRNRYRSADILLIDDIQIITNKTSTQEAFFHMFNDLYDRGKQIIISSDRPPKEITPLEERLRSRFGWGLIADIQPPDLETKIAILQRKSQASGYNIDPKVINYIAENNDTNIRELEENLNRVYFHSTLFNKPLDIDVAIEILRERDAENNESLSIDVIIDVVCNYYHVTREDLIGKKKNKEIVYPRQMCIYLITEILTMPLAAIGAIFGGRDHTTVMHARDKISQDLQNNPKIKTACHDIRSMIYKK